MRLIQIINALILLMISTLIIMPAAEAWSWKTHSDIADAVYYGLPPEIQKNLNLAVMENASNDPDEIFKDFTYHSYPKSYNKAKTWLDKGKTAYDNKDYTEASQDYGIASHYISDTFSAPHCVNGEAYTDHSKYEDQAKQLKPTATYTNEDLNSMMQNGYNQGSKSWGEWLLNKDNATIQNDLNRGASASLSAIKDSINSKPTPNILTSIYYFILNLFHTNNRISLKAT
jgi:Zinc dependent phospholipase C